MRQMLGAEIRGEIAAQGLGITEVAARAGMERTSLWRYLKGERAMPLDALVALADALQLDASELVQRAEQRARRNPQVGGEAD